MSRQEIQVDTRFDGSVSAALPLALLESVRAHDRPGEILEDEDLATSLPRRLGLTGVIETQIYRFETAQKAGRAVRFDEVMGLFRLVMRRPDAEPILRETGQRMARWYFRRTSRLWLRMLHGGPASLSLRSARMRAVRALQGIRAGTKIRATKPFTVQIDDCAPARLEDSGAGCTLVTGLVEEQLLLSTGRPRRVRHTCCLARGDDRCEWTVIEAD